MRVAIVAPSISPSFDGVADYSTRLAHALCAQGHAVLLLGLNDLRAAPLNLVDDGLSSLSLPGNLPWPERRVQARAALAAFKPDGLTVQYYWREFRIGRNGWDTAALLGDPGLSRRRHIMYHETWQETATASRVPAVLRHLAIQFMIVSFYRRLRAHAAFTSTDHYARQLGCLAIKAQIAAVPSTIAVAPADAPAEARVWAQIQAAGAGPAAREATWVAVMFGRIPKEWPAEEAMPWLRRIQQASGLSNGIILSIGKTDYEDRGWQRTAAAATTVGLRAVKLGMQEAEIVSRALRLGDLGVVTTRGGLLHKSTTYAAMAEHGLPIFVLDPNGAPAPGGQTSLIFPGDQFAATSASAKRQSPQADRWAALARAYTQALSPVRV